MEDEDGYEVVIPTAPEDELDSSFNNSAFGQSPEESTPSRPSPVPSFSPALIGPLNPQTINRPPKPRQDPVRPKGPKRDRSSGLPSHAFSRNYYCRYCSFNTTKSKVHLYHLVDVHGVDYKIFSCDRCDYASRWKCKVIRHRKMIHKINEPKFEPEMHDSRGQAGKRPPPLPVSQPTTTSSQSPVTSKAQIPDLPTSFAQSSLSAILTPSQLPKPFNIPAQFLSGLNPMMSQLNPFLSQLQASMTPPAVKADTPSAAIPENTNRRKQRKPQSTRKVEGDEYVPKSEPMDSTNNNSPTGDEPIGLSDLFGGGLNDSHNSDSGGILNGGSWRRRLMPTAVGHIAYKENSNDVKSNSTKSSPTGSKSVSESMSRESLYSPALSSSSLIPPTQPASNPQQKVDDELSEEDKDRSVEEIMIDDEPHYRCAECNFISKFRWKTTKHYKANHNTNKSYKCTVCDFTTLNRVDFFSHKATHSTRGMHKCDECAYIASSKTNLDRHMVNHRQSNPVKCLYCSFSSTGEAAIQRHMAEHHNQSELPLAMRRQFPDMDETTEGSTEEFNCELCEYTARNWSKMKEHMIRHSEGTPFACSYCESKYKRPADLNRHLKIKHNTCLADIGLDGPTLKGVLMPDGVGEDYEISNLKRSHDDSDTEDPKKLCIDEEPIDLNCKKCNYIAKWPSDLDRHMKVHSEDKRFGCPICRKSYKYQGDLNVHMRRNHNGVSTSKKSPSGLKPIPVTPGAKTPPPNVQVLSNEVIVNMSHAAILNPLANLSAPAGPKYPAEFPSPTSFTPQMPVLKPAPQRGSSPSASQSKSSGHISVNADGKRIKKGELDPITMIHVPGGEFKCLNCSYETNFKSHLDAHMRIHPEKPFHCMFCNYASYWRGDTKKHIEKNHPDKLPAGVNPYNLVEQVFEEAVKNSPHRSKPLPEVHNLPAKSEKPERGTIWTPPNEDSVSSVASFEQKSPSGKTTPSLNASGDAKESTNADGVVQVSCPHCTYYTTSESRLSAHMATHYNLKIFKCPACGKRANWKWDIQKHMRQEHPDCTDSVLCMDTEEARATLDEYLKDHPEQRGKPKISVPQDFKPDHWPKPRDMTSSSKTTSIRPFKCSVCGRRSNWKCDIRKHYRQVHPGRDDAKVELMTREELIEAGEKPQDVEQFYPETKPKTGQAAVRPFKCSVCGKNSRWKWDVTKHIKMVHRGDTQAHVIEDEEPDDDAEELESVDTSYDESGASSPTMPALLSGSNAPSPKSGNKPVNSPKIGCYQCSVCSQFSEFMWVIRRHIRSLHPDNPEAKIVDLSNKGGDAAVSDSRPYICSLCGKRSNWKWDVKKHILSVHKGSMGSILDELLNKETVIYVDGKTMEVDSNAAERIAEIKDALKEGKDRSESPAPRAVSSPAIQSNNCYNGLPTMVGLQSAVAPNVSSPMDTNEASMSSESSQNGDNSSVKFKCGYCFYVSPSRNETVRHVRSEHAGKILRIQTLNRGGTDEQTTYKAAHRTSTVTTISMWQCSQCEYKSPHKEEALTHIQQHNLYNAYQCAICDYADDMEYSLHKHIKATHEEVDNVEDVLLQNILYAPCADDTDTPTGVTYTCNECEMKTAWRSAIVRHIKEKHIVDGDIHSMFTKHGSGSSKTDASGDGNRRYNCTVCPYRTDKVGMFNEHMQRHKPRNETDIKCPHCDYWVAANRLLHQHLRLHLENGNTPASASNGGLSPKEKTRERYSMSGGLAQCPDCPYRGKPKDLNQHRRLHKQRPGAIYKCPDCPYWVSHGRLLQQHVKVHAPSYRQRLSYDGEPSDTDVAAFKSHLINSQVENAELENGDGAKRQMFYCSKCPYANTRQCRLKAHEEMHGAATEGALKCKFCDFYTPIANRTMMSHHIKVHSLQYQGEYEDPTALSEKNGEGVGVESAAGYDMKFTENNVVSLGKQKEDRKYCCEKCSYCSAQKENFRRHMSLHGSKQGHTCAFCDYSVPSSDLLTPHVELHRQPNRNLLATQSIMNLTKLKPISADVQLAQSGELVDGSVTEVHDHLDLYENAVTEAEEAEMYSDAREGDDDDDEPEFIDLAELGSKVSEPVDGSGDEEMEEEEGEEVWICRFCDRVFDSENELVGHEKEHKA